MKKINRALAVLLAAVLALGILTACSGSSSNSTKDLAQKMGVASKAKHIEALDDCADKYLEYKNSGEEKGGPTDIIYFSDGSISISSSFSPLSGKSKTESEAALKASGITKEYIFVPIMATGNTIAKAETNLASRVENISAYQSVLGSAEYYGIYEGNRNFGVDQSYVVILVAIAK